MKNLEAKRIYERMIQLYEEFTKSETYNRGSILGEFIEKSKQLCAIKADAEFESSEEIIPSVEQHNEENKEHVEEQKNEESNKLNNVQNNNHVVSYENKYNERRNNGYMKYDKRK